MKSLGPWMTRDSAAVLGIVDRSSMQACRCAPDGKLVASITCEYVHGKMYQEYFVALIHVTYPDMAPKERELAERGQSIPVSEGATLEQTMRIADAWLEEIGFDARPPATIPDYVI